ncbi:MAG: aminodeoxychorismate synthase component I [Proteobacteria bacterium]|nr:aminodeoxychorismate synthase component I [Pseudomonadota bacterium]
MEPTVRSFSAECDPLRLIARFPDRYPGILESGSRRACDGSEADTQDSRFDILPMANGEFLALPAEGRLRGWRSGGGFLDALGAWCRQIPPVSPSFLAPSALPFRGGWLVYLGYEIAAEVEPTLKLPRSSDALAALALRAPAAWVRDRHTGQCWLIAEPGQESLLERFEAHCEQVAGEALPSPALELLIHEEEPLAFLARVQRSLDYIAAGDIYQANLSRGWHAQAPWPLDPVQVYRRLRSANPGPFCALLRYGDFAVVSSSPERLVMSDGHRVRTRPIAGTRPRGATAGADAELVRQLLDNEKERAEHVMLIDLERNDLGRVCVGGSVRVDEFMMVESYAHVHHIVSNVSGSLRPGVGVVDVLRAVFPGGTITGCPKVRCMQIIAELEKQGRGAYTGSLGYINIDGSADFNILIRTMSVNGKRLDFRAGAGIVADSDPERELEETRAKAEGLIRALQPA